MKAVLVIDVEEKDIGRKVNYVSVQGGGLSYIVGTMGEDVRLRPLPQNVKAGDERFWKLKDGCIAKEHIHYEFANGWNACLDEITGETE